MYPVRYPLIPAIVAIMILAACSRDESGPPPDPAVIQQAKILQPTDARLATLYQQSCRACHMVGAGGAPLTGDQAAWDIRWRKGAEALRTSAIRGLNGMPPGAQCFTCSSEDYDALIRFMAGR